MDELIVALDSTRIEQTKLVVKKICSSVGAFKIGPILFTSMGPAAVDMVHNLGGKVFLDLKWHDIPNTVAEACREAVRQGVFMVNIHISGGVRMINAARNAIDQEHKQGIKPLLLGVTVLTSFKDKDLISIGVERPIKYQVSNLTDLAVSAGIDGVVASGWEVPTIKEKWQKIIAVVPGIRPKWEMKKKQILSDDQFRIMSPIEALKNGADYLVVGRPVMENKDPVKAVSLIKEEIKLWQN